MTKLALLGARARLSRQGLTEFATVHHAQLAPWKPTEPTGLEEGWQWCSVPAAMESMEKIDLMIVDGPPGSTCRYARYPAVPFFRARMGPECIVLLDDTRREDERVIARTWSKEWAMELREHPEFEKGLAVLTPDLSRSFRRIG